MLGTCSMCVLPICSFISPLVHGATRITTTCVLGTWLEEVTETQELQDNVLMM